MMDYDLQSQEYAERLYLAQVNAPLKVVCGWCHKTMTEGRSYPDGSVSHGICPDCYKRYFESDLGPIEGGATGGK